MAYPATAAETKTGLNLPATIDDAMLEQWFPAAAARLRVWVGTAAYDDSMEETPDDEERALWVKLAFILLVGVFVWDMLAHRVGPAGNAASGTDGEQSWNLKSRADVDNEKQALLSQAEIIAGPYTTRAKPKIINVPAGDEEV